MERRCAGLPYVGIRPLTEGESAQLQARAYKSKRALSRAAMATIVLLIVWPASFAIIIEWRLGEFALLDMVPFVAMVGVIVFSLKWIDAAKVAKHAIPASRETEVEIFEGVPDESAYLERELALLSKGGLLGPEDDEVQKLERLPRSAVVLAINDKSIDLLIRASASDIAEFPTSTSSFPSRVFKLAPDRTHPTRGLSGSELTELKSHIRATYAKPPWFAIFALIYLLIGVVTLTLRTERDTGDSIQLVFLYMILIGLYVPGIFKRVRLYQTLRRDFDSGFVLIYEARFEVLPHSQLIWSEDRKPGLWRRAMGSDTN